MERHSRQKQEASTSAARSQESLPRRPVGTPRQVVVISLQSRSPSPISHRVSRFSTTMTTPVQVGREVRTAPSTPSQTYRGVSGIVAAPKSQCLGTPRSGAALNRTSRKPVVLPAWPSLAAWTTYQPGSAGTPGTPERTIGTVSTVKRQVSTASAVERQISTASAPTEQFSKAGTLLSHGRSLSSSGRFSSTLAWSPRTVASSFHLSPRVQKFVLKPCSSFPSAPTPRVPPVVHIDLTSAQTPAASQVKATPRSGRELQARAISPREAKIEAEPRSKAIGSEDSDEDSDEVKELSSDSWAMARHREDGRMPSAERQLCRLPGTVVL